MRHPRRVEGIVYGATAALVFYLVSGPLLVLLVTAFRGTADALPFEPQAAWTLGNFTDIARDPVLYRTVVPTTVIYTVAAVGIALTLSVFFAWLIERTTVPAPNMLFVLIVSPVVIPTVVKAIAWVFLLGPNAGLVNVILRRTLAWDAPGPFNIQSLPGVILVQALELVPLGLIFMTTAFRNMDPSLEEISYACGARPLVTFFRVTLGVLAPATLGLAIIATTLTLEMVEVPLAIGTPAGIQVFSTWMYFTMNPAGVLPDYGRLAASVTPVLLVGFVFLFLYRRATRLANRYATVTGRGYRPRRRPIGAWKAPALAVAFVYVLTALALPALVMLMMSVYPQAGRTGAGILGPFSPDAYARVFADPVTQIAFRNTFLAGGLGTTAAVVLALLAAWFTVRTSLPGRSVLDGLCFVPLTIPAIIMGFAIGLVYLVLPIPIYGTVWILAVAYATRIAVSSRILQASLVQIHHELEEASAVAGASWLTTMRRVVAPLLLPAMLVSWLLLFVVCFREFTVGMILYRPSNVVVGVHLWNLYARGRMAEASALGFVMIVIVLTISLLGRRLVFSEVARG